MDLYRLDGGMIEEIRGISSREFGFVFKYSDGSTYVSRKLTFDTQRELVNYICTKKPLDCYVSVAYYKYPTELKGWFGSDLFFDLDSKEDLKLAYADALTVYEVLLDDFGLKNVVVNFSGSKGYHVISSDKEVLKLGKCERKEIADYMVIKYGVKTLDVVSTVDLKRLRRIVGTINSKSGEECRRVNSMTT